MWPMPLDHARAEVLLDLLGRGRRRCTQEGRFELRSVRPVVDPDARRLNEFAGADRGGVTDDGDQVSLALALTRRTQPLSACET